MGGSDGAAMMTRAFFVADVSCVNVMHFMHSSVCSNSRAIKQSITAGSVAR